MNFVEVVHVKLSNKRGVSIVPVVARQDVLFQFFLIQDADAFELSVPEDNFGVLFGLDRGKNTRRILQSLLMKAAGF